MEWEWLLHTTRILIPSHRGTLRKQRRGWWDQGGIPGQSDSWKTHFKINLCRIHETLSGIGLTRHPEIWHGSLPEDKSQDSEVSYFLSQQGQLTCSESRLLDDQEGTLEGNAAGQGLNMLGLVGSR